jgi:hypothetical protein
VRIEVVDPSGYGLGLAIGLAQLGHEVAHRGRSSWAAATDDVARCSRDLQRHFCLPASDDGTADLVVLVDVFADALHQLTHGIGIRGHDAAGDPLADTTLPLGYPDRLDWYLRCAAAAEHVVVVDASDHREQREVAFAALPHTTLLARECAPTGDGPWRPFPFLWNHVLLWLDLLQPRAGWWIPPERRERTHDWAFCGTVDHERYGGQRRAWLQELERRWPTRRGRVLTDGSFFDTIRVCQQAGFGVDLPGVGETCFRLHECLLLGTPLVRPFPRGHALAPGLRAVVVDDPERLVDVDPTAVRAVYDACYSPAAAARRLLAAARSSAIAPTTL